MPSSMLSVPSRILSKMTGKNKKKRKTRMAQVRTPKSSRQSPSLTLQHWPHHKCVFLTVFNDVPDSHSVIRTLLMNTITHGKLIAPQRKRVRVRLLQDRPNNLSRNRNPRSMRRGSHNLLHLQWPLLLMFPRHLLLLPSRHPTRLPNLGPT